MDRHFFIYLNFTSPDTIQALFYLSVCDMNFTTKYSDLSESCESQHLVKAKKAFGIPLKMSSK